MADASRETTLVDALHSCINQKDGDYHPQVAVISKKCQQPCSQDNTSPDNGEEPYAVLLDIAANEYNRRRTCQSAQTECPDNIVIRKEALASSGKQGNSTTQRTSHKPMPPSTKRYASTGIWQADATRISSDPHNFHVNEQAEREASCKS